MSAYILYTLLAIFVLIVLTVLIRTFTMKPTSARTATPTAGDETRSAEYAERLSRMIQKETISSRYDADKTKFYEFHQLLEELFPNIHKTCEKHVFNGSLLFKWSGKYSDAPIGFMSHHDVVEAGGTWQEPPFSGAVKDGLIWGRGTVDTKGSLFCFLTAVEELISEGIVPEQDVYLMSSCTEEFSGEGAPLTAKYFVENGIHLAMMIDEGGMIVTEPIAGVNGTYAMVGTVEKGYGDLKFIARSSGGHASAPSKNTPIARLSAFVCDVEKNYPFRADFSPTVLEMFRRFAPNMSTPMRAVFGNLWLFSGLLKKMMPSISPAGAAMLRTTIAFTMAQGSSGLNVLPQEAFVTGNLRFIQHQGTEESIGIIREIAKKYDLETEIIYADQPCKPVDFCGAAFQKVEAAIHEIYPGIGVSPYVMTGGTDCKFYGDVCDNCIRFAPIYINKQQYGSIHGLNENITASALPPAVDFYKKIVRGL